MVQAGLELVTPLFPYTLLLLPPAGMTGVCHLAGCHVGLSAEEYQSLCLPELQ